MRDREETSSRLPERQVHCAVEDGEAVGQDWLIHIQVIVMDEAQHQGGVGGVLAGLLGLGAGL
jgi:hypothetical protein